LGEITGRQLYELRIKSLWRFFPVYWWIFAETIFTHFLRGNSSRFKEYFIDPDAHNLRNPPALLVNIHMDWQTRFTQTSYLVRQALHGPWGPIWALIGWHRNHRFPPISNFVWDGRLNTVPSLVHILRFGSYWRRGRRNRSLAQLVQFPDHQFSASFIFRPSLRDHSRDLTIFVTFLTIILHTSTLVED